MAEKKVTCPNCMNTDKCFEEQVSIESFSSLCALIVVIQVIRHTQMILNH